MGHRPDWQTQSYAKGASTAKVSSNSSIQSRPIFHSEGQHSMGQPVRRFADGGDVDYDKTDSGLFGGEVKYREDSEGRKFVPTSEVEQRYGAPKERGYISGSDIKDGLSRMFGGGKKDSAPEPKATANAGDNSSEWDSGRKPMMSSEPKAFPSPTENKTNYGNNSDSEGQSNMGNRARSAMGTDSPDTSNKPSQAPKVSAPDASKSKPKASVSSDDSAPKRRAAQFSGVTRVEGQAFPTKGEQSKSYPVASKSNDARPSKPYPNVGTGFPSPVKDGPRKADSIDRAVDKTVKDTSGAKTVYSDKPFSFTKSLEAGKAKAAADKAEAERKARTRKSMSDIRYDEMGNAY